MKRLIFIFIFLSSVANSQSTVLTPACGVSWTACGLYSPSVDTFYLSPGDYNSLGDIAPTLSGTQSNPKVVIHLDHDSLVDIYNHPVKYPDTAYYAQISGLNLSIDSFWIFRGLHIEDYSILDGDKKYGNASIIDSSYQCKIDYCTIDSIYSTAAIRIRQSSNYNEITNCVIKGARINAGTDIIGITVQSGYGTESRGNLIENNEILGYSDAVQLNYTNGSPNKEGAVPGTKVINNEFYLTHFADSSSAGIYSFGENGIDIKVGSVGKDLVGGDLADSSRVIVALNTMYNFTPSCSNCLATGGGGEAIVIQNNAHNIHVFANIIANSNVGLSMTRSSLGNDIVSNNNVYNNVFFNIKKYTTGTSSTNVNRGTVFVLTHDDSLTNFIYNNVLYQCNGIGDIRNQGLGMTFKNNQLIESQNLISSTYSESQISDYINWTNTVLKNNGNQSKAGVWSGNTGIKFTKTIKIKRWTNPTIVTWEELKALEPQ